MQDKEQINFSVSSSKESNKNLLGYYKQLAYL